ncbi:lipocalin-like domain-containing protein [Promicromonospora panici]|uniref:lipocalin-like domain-containing protein n=1 Tax=Promicromonospora panici TaxID=2219658 RepID=UPI00101B7095|nr:lipocalin-like domain-containing protein [Promicromonospora panici]
MLSTKKLLAAPLALGLALLMTACTPTGSATQTGSATEPEETDPLTGQWQITSLEAGTEGDLEPVPYSGQIIFTEADTMAVQAMNPDTEAPDTPYTVNGYEAYYGNVAIDEADGTFEVTIESAAVRDLIGQSLTRNFEVSDDALVLTPADPAEGWRVTYERS